MLLSLVLSLSILSFVYISEMKRERDKQIDRSFELTGQGIARVGNALNNALSRDFDSFINADPTPGAPLTIKFKSGAVDKTVTLGHWDTPTVAELAQLEVGLPPNFSGSAPGGGAFRIIVSKSPVGCVGSNCNIEGLAYVTVPALVGGKIDQARAGIALRAIGVDGATTTVALPGVLQGYRGGWSTPSPVNAAGILAMRAGYGASAWSPFFRIDGTKQMAADANIGGHALVNASELFTTLKAVGDPCTDVGAVAGGTVNGKGAAFVCRDSTWQLAGGKTANLGDPCSPEGSLATAISTDETLVCKNGQYIKLINMLARNIEVSRTLVKDGDVVTKPTCAAGGTPDYTFNLNNFSVDVTTAPPKQAVYITTANAGAAWNVILRLRADNGTETTGNTYSLTAIMHLECKY